MENCTLIDETEDKAIPITAQYFRQPLKFRHPSKEQATECQIRRQWSIHKRTWARTSVRTHTHARAPWLLKHGCTYKSWQEHCGETATTRYLILTLKLKAQTCRFKPEIAAQNSPWARAKNQERRNVYTVRRKNAFRRKMTCLLPDKCLWIITEFITCTGWTLPAVAIRIQKRAYRGKWDVGIKWFQQTSKAFVNSNWRQTHSFYWIFAL